MDSSLDTFETPLYNVSEAAAYLGVPPSTFRAWTRGYTNRPVGRKPVSGKPVVTSRLVDRSVGVPFIGLAEGLVLAAIRRQGVPLQRIRPAIDALKREFSIEHALASKRLYTDGAEVLYDIASTDTLDAPSKKAAKDLIVVRNNQRVFSQVVEDYLQRLDFGPDGYAHTIHLPAYTEADVIATPDLSFGKPVFAASGARVSDALNLFYAGESLAKAAEEFGVPSAFVEEAIRVASSRAA